MEYTKDDIYAIRKSTPTSMPIRPRSAHIQLSRRMHNTLKTPSNVNVYVKEKSSLGKTLKNKYNDLIEKISNVSVKEKSPTYSNHTHTRKRKRSQRSPDKENEKKRKRARALNEFEKLYHIDKTDIKAKLKEILRNPPKRVLEYLRKVCPDSNTCIGFGEETAKISYLYRNFTDFKFIKKENTKMVSHGANGVVLLLEYEREGYSTYATLKMPIRHKDKVSDNIFQDVVNGYYINGLNNYYPCFMETYGMFRFVSDLAYATFLGKQLNKDSAAKLSIEYSKLLHPLPYSMDYIHYSCTQPHLTAVLVQYINKPITLYTYLTEKIKDEYVFVVELVHILYQIYSVLAACAYDFTHYDLHPNNVLLYKIPGDKYVTLEYHDITDKVIRFKTQYIVKLIDYGRCFTSQMEELYDRACLSRYCEKPVKSQNRGCGYMNGYKHFVFDATPKNAFISSIVPNVSHDLRLAYGILNAFSTDFYEYMGPSSILTERVVEVYDLFTNIQYDGTYGTPEILPGDMDSEHIIYNVFDMHWRLLSIVDNEYRIETNNNYYQNMESAGKMVITLDRTKDLKFDRASA